MDSPIKQAVVGVVAHVDAGKSTLIESVLLQTGAIRQAGRIDHGTAHVDTLAAERARGITIKNKQVVVEHAGLRLMMIDTPGHMDFIAEAERALRVLDYAILVVGANDGLQGQSRALWRLLRRFSVPTFVFVNKLDFVVDTGNKITSICEGLGEGAIPVFDAGSDPSAEGAQGGCPRGFISDKRWEQLAMADEEACEEYLETGELALSTLQRLVDECKVFPVFGGSALKQEGIDRLLEGLRMLVRPRQWPQAFGAQVYGVSTWGAGDRVTWLKITGGVLHPRDMVTIIPTSASTAEESNLCEKVAQVRNYQGAKYALLDKAAAGTLCGVTGLNHVRPGDGLGAQPPMLGHAVEPVMSYSVRALGKDAAILHQALAQLCDEDPLLGLSWDQSSSTSQLKLMGTVQKEIVAAELKDRFGLTVEFGPGAIIYRETLTAPMHGVGHFEPLRHYAEVHVLLEPLPVGSGVVFGATCSEDFLDRNWQRLIMINAMEKPHRGVLTGSELTDVRITLLAGKAHAKHTVGGDFRQATYRAIRQALMQARAEGKCQLLEPWMTFELQVPSDKVGRSLSDMALMSAEFESPEPMGDGVVLRGVAPAATIQGYGTQVAAYTGGRGLLLLESQGYAPCHNADAVMEESAYDPKADRDNPPDSVFCSHGAGYNVNWDQVYNHAHVLVEDVPQRPWVPADAKFFGRQR